MSIPGRPPDRNEQVAATVLRARLSDVDIRNLMTLARAVKDVVSFDRGRCSGHGWEDMVEAYDAYWQERAHPLDDELLLADADERLSDLVCLRDWMRGRFAADDPGLVAVEWVLHAIDGGAMNDDLAQPPSADADVCHIPWNDRFAIWRMNWFPYRTYESLDDDAPLNDPSSWGPAVWQWPNVLRRPHRG